jgi:hypothetical protein
MADAVINRSLVEEALENTGQDAGSILRYSGRAMFGAECFGIVGDLGLLVEFVAALTMLYMDEYGEAPDWLAGVRQDLIGRSQVFYWPQVALDSWPQDDEEEVD